MNVLDLFCGCGGMSHGLKSAGLNVVAGIDIWQKAIDNYQKNNDHLAICRDLTQFPPQEFADICKERIDILVGSPPCQTFSIAGKRDENDPRNSLYMEFVKYLDFFQPLAFMMENVVGMLSAKLPSGENSIDIIMENLSRNYNTAIFKLYASDYEVPQNRRRVIIIGFRKDIDIIPTQPPPVTNKQRIAVKTILQPIDEIPHSYFLSEKAIEGINRRKENSKKKGNGFGSQFLDPDLPSYTITSRYWKDGSDALVYYDDTTIRKLTITELKRIQSFPDEYILEGSKKDVTIQIGNAVACRFAYHLGRYLINTLQQQDHSKSRNYLETSSNS